MDLPDDVWMLVFDSLNEKNGYYEPASIIRWELAFLKCSSHRFYQLIRAYLSRYAVLTDDLFGEDPDLQPPDYLCTYLAYRGYVSCLKYAHSHGSPWEINTTENAALGGKLNCLIYAHESGCDWDSRICAAAATGGHLDCLTYAIENGCASDADTTRCAIANGHLNCFNYAVQKKCKVDRDAVAAVAITYRQFDIFKQLVQDEYPVVHATVLQAAISGNIECLKIAVEKHPHTILGNKLVEISEAAAKAGSVEGVIYLHQIGLAPNSTTINAAAIYGHLDLVKYLHNNNFACSHKTANLAAQHGHLHVLQFLHENGCPWDETTCAAAASQGHIEVLRYLHLKKCPWDSDTMYRALEFGSLACVKYLHENGCPWPEDPCKVTWNYDVIEYVHSQQLSL